MRLFVNSNLNIFLVCLVSSHAIKETFFKTFIALGEISFRLPIGVPTTYKTLLSGSCLCEKIGFIIHSVISLPLGVNINNLIDDLRIISWEAADILLYYSKLLKIQVLKNILSNKNIDDPVTLADLKVNETVIKRLKDKYKDVNWEILSEENVKTISNNFNRNADWIWILDPLDGTKDFIQGTGNYAMHLALNFKNKPFLGIVLIPERDELWIAFKGQVFCEKRNGTKKFLVRKSSSIISEITLVTSKNHVNPTLTKLIEMMNFKKVIEMGSVGCRSFNIKRGG